MGGGAQRLGVVLQQHRPDAGVSHDPAVRLGQLHLQAGDETSRICADAVGGRMQPVRDVLVARGRGGELDDVRFRHAVEPVEPGSAVRGEPDQDRGPGDAVGQHRRAGQRVRPAAGPADDGKPLQPVPVGYGRDVGSHVSDLAAP